MDTIFALASAPGKAGVAVIRVSGPEAERAVCALAGTLPAPRVAGLRRLHDDQGRYLDEAVILVFPGPGSFTGETVVEIQTHGSIAVVRSVLAALGDIPGLRHAEAGEFTRRALLNGRLDLTQVEALSDLIEAETEAQRRQAVQGFSGALGAAIGDWREKLIRSAALLEATIDFVDEEVPMDVTEEVCDLIAAVDTSMRAQLAGLDAAERVRLGFEVAIIGPPNAGKSTLLNHLAGRDAAITSDVAGTTRDVIEVRMDIAGLAVTLLDTAGLRESEDTVEKIGVARAQKRADDADLRLHLVPEGEHPILSVRQGDFVLVAKDDHGSHEAGISGVTGHGTQRLLSEIGAVLAGRVSGAALANRDRHRVAIEQGLRHLESARDLLAVGPDVYELASEELRSCLRKMEMLLGHVDVEHVLGEIFSKFCVGK